MKSRLLPALAISVIFVFWGCSDDPSMPSEDGGAGCPTCVLTSPADGDTVGFTVWLRAEAEDSDGIVRVDFLIDDEVIVSDFIEPFEYKWNTASIEQWTVPSIHAVAYDPYKMQMKSNAISVTIHHGIGPPPAVELERLIADYNAETLILYWTESVVEDFHQYVVRRSQIPDVTPASPAVAVIGEPATTTFEDNTILKEQAYYYRVYVEDEEGMAGESNEMSGILYDLPGDCNFGEMIITDGTANPVITGLDVGASLSKVYEPSVVFQDGVYYLWLAAWYEHHWEIAAATSSNGVDWESYANNPVVTVGTSGEFDPFWIRSPEVIFDEEDGLFKMWYAGRASNTYCVGYAESPDGTTWTKYPGNPVLMPAELPWEGDSVLPEAVVKRSGTYHMWYAASLSGTQYETVTGFATSSDGIHWMKYPDPVFARGSEPFEVETAWISDVQVMPNGNYEALYSASPKARYPVYIAFGRAVSEDGIIWIRDLSNPIITRDEQIPWKEDAIRDPSFLRQGDHYEIWYCGDGGPWLIGMDTGVMICP